MIGLVWATEAGRRMALGLAEAWPRSCTVYSGPVREQLARAWPESSSIVAFLATGATIRLVASLLSGKQSDPGVVCVDEAGRYAVALLGGHEAGANLLAEQVAEVLGAQAVVTTATDSVGFPGLDMMGFKVGNPERLAAVSRAMLDGLPIAWHSDNAWPLPALPPNVGDHRGGARHAVHVTDRRPPPAPVPDNADAALTRDPAASPRTQVGPNRPPTAAGAGGREAPRNPAATAAPGSADGSGGDPGRAGGESGGDPSGRDGSGRGDALPSGAYDLGSAVGGGDLRGADADTTAAGFPVSNSGDLSAWDGRDAPWDAGAKTSGAIGGDGGRPGATWNGSNGDEAAHAAASNHGSVADPAGVGQAWDAAGSGVPGPIAPPSMGEVWDAAGSGVPGPIVRPNERADLIADTNRNQSPPMLVLHPPSLVLGIGASRGVAKGEIAALVDYVLADAGLAAESVRCIATADIKASEAGLVEFGEERGWPIVTYPAADLAAIEVPHPSEVVRQAVGTPSVSEAAALLAARQHGRDATLIVPKTVSAMATVAVARLAPRGRLAIVGLGPGADDLRTPRATTELRRAAIVVGLDQYVDQIRHLLRPGTRVVASGLGAEEERARNAVELAREGNAVALIGSGDAGVYAMASPALEFADKDIDIYMVPGVTAALAAAALLGAPLGHDHVYLSLSDLHTPWQAIERRLHAAADSDLVVCLYNPRSTRRTHQLPEALAILGKHRPPETPVGLVRNAFREGQRITRTMLATIDPEDVDMNTVVIVGSSTTRELHGRMVTPRGYRWS